MFSNWISRERFSGCWIHSKRFGAKLPLHGVEKGGVNLSLSLSLSLSPYSRSCGSFGPRGAFVCVAGKSKKCVCRQRAQQLFSSYCVTLISRMSKIFVDNNCRQLMIITLTKTNNLQTFFSHDKFETFFFIIFLFLARRSGRRFFFDAVFRPSLLLAEKMTAEDVRGRQDNWRLISKLYCRQPTDTRTSQGGQNYPDR